jgi:putative peptide modification system cyclase
MHGVDDPPANDGLDVPAGSRLPNPKVRTLLLTDLCDSTMLVERLGDNAAAELFRAHDRLVLQLQQQWRGRLIDRSDGLLLLFERAIDGLGFALDYARGLRVLGADTDVARHGVELRARAGLHVGEVLTWRNSDAAVNVGAKPLEVEGLAKPMAGRLMTLARPGQILLSATAEPLAHRAVRELGERGEQLLWKPHGRWRFKGVPQAQDIYEVGEPGIAPLRAPQQNRAKAWRDIPLWRRPAALAAELLLVAGLAGGAWFMTRPQPAIAFGERDWVVVGDLRNLTGDKLLDESLEQAFRISLEQSRYVNVLSDLKARDTLGRMRRRPDTVLDRTVASEIALRDGARAVILPTVAEIGGRVRVSAEVIDPHTQTTVYAATSDGSGAGSTLHSIDKVTAELRARLGEALESIQKNSVLLPNVTTSNLDALKAYAVGRRYADTGHGKEAVAYYQRAAQLDPRFALAMVAAGSTYMLELNDYPSARREFARAAPLRDRLSARDGLRYEAALARVGAPAAAMQASRQLLDLYPDELGAQRAMGQIALFESNDPASALRHARAAAVLQSERQASAHYLVGMALVALGKPDQAKPEFQLSREQGFEGDGYSHAYAYAAERDWPGVQRVLDAHRKSGIATHDANLPSQKALFEVDRGRWSQARSDALEAMQIAEAGDPLMSATFFRVNGLVIDVLSGGLDHGTAEARIQRELRTTRANAAGLGAHYAPMPAYSFQALGYLAALNDSEQPLRQAIERADAFGDGGEYPLIVQTQTILRAELERIQGRPEAAVRSLRALAGADDSLVIAHFSLLRALRASGDDAGVAREAAWLAAHRGAAYIEQPAADMLTAASVAATDLALLAGAEAAARMGDVTGASRLRAAFVSAWDPAQRSPAIERRVHALEGAGISRP